MGCVGVWGCDGGMGGSILTGEVGNWNLEQEFLELSQL